MKTALEIIESKCNSGTIRRVMTNQDIIDCMVEYAEQALDEAANKATLWVETPINGTEFDKLEEDLAADDDTTPYPQVTTVFKESILKLKGQLK